MGRNKIRITKIEHDRNRQVSLRIFKFIKLKFTIKLKRRLLQKERMV